MTDTEQRKPCRITGVSLYKIEITLEGPVPKIEAHYDLIEDHKDRGILFHGRSSCSQWGPDVEQALETFLDKLTDDLNTRHFEVDEKKQDKKKGVSTLFPDRKPKRPRQI